MKEIRRMQKLMRITMKKSENDENNTEKGRLEWKRMERKA